jgi:hypothetical protein
VHEEQLWYSKFFKFSSKILSLTQSNPIVHYSLFFSFSLFSLPITGRTFSGASRGCRPRGRRCLPTAPQPRPRAINAPIITPSTAAAAPLGHVAATPS